MHKTMKLKINTDVLYFLLIGIIIIVSDDTLFFGTNSNEYFILLKYITLIVLSLIWGLTHIHRSVSVAFGVCLGMCLMVLLSCIFNADFRIGYFYKCTLLILAYEIATTVPIKKLAFQIDKIMFFLTASSIIGMVVATFAKPLLNFLPIFTNSAGVKFYNSIIFMIEVTDYTLRNFGIFREPGVFQVYIIIAFILHLYNITPNKISHIFVYVIGVILTFSTTGYLALASLMLLYLIKKNKDVKARNKKIIIILFFIFGLIYMAFQTTLLSSEGIIFNKFSNMKRHTTIARFASFSSNFEIWIKYPIFGAGLKTVGEQFSILTYFKYGYATEHNTNTLMNELATYGIIYTFVFVIGFYKFIKKTTQNKIEQALILLTLFLLSCGEKLTFSPIIYIFIFYGFKKKENITYGEVESKI